MLGFSSAAEISKKYKPCLIRPYPIQEPLLKLVMGQESGLWSAPFACLGELQRHNFPGANGKPGRVLPEINSRSLPSPAVQIYRVAGTGCKGKLDFHLSPLTAAFIKSQLIAALLPEPTGNGYRFRSYRQKASL